MVVGDVGVLWISGKGGRERLGSWGCEGGFERWDWGGALC